MKDHEFLTKLMKELLASGTALTMFNADTEEFSIVPKNEFFIMPNGKKRELKIIGDSFSTEYGYVSAQGRALTNAEIDSVIKPHPKWKVDAFPYVGKTIVLTGDMTKLVTRSWLKRHLTQRGAIVKNSVTAETNLVVAGVMYEPSQKMLKAYEYGIKIENYAVFLHCIGYEDRRQKPAEPAYVNHARPSQRAAAEKAVGVPTYTGARLPNGELNPFSNEGYIDTGIKKRDDSRTYSLEEAMIKLGKSISYGYPSQQLGRGMRPDKIEYTANIRPDGSADIFKYVNGIYSDVYSIPKALLDGCKALDGKGHNGKANWSYGDSYARIALENKFGKRLVELCREHIVSKL